MENENTKVSREQMCLTAGFCMGLSVSDRFALDEMERAHLRTASLVLFELLKISDDVDGATLRDVIRKAKEGKSEQ